MSIYISLVGESCNYLAQFLIQKYAESQSTKKKGSPFQSQFNALGPTCVEVTSVRAMHPVSRADEAEAYPMSSTLVLVMSPVLTPTLHRALGASSQDVGSLAMARHLRAELSII